MMGRVGAMVKGWTLVGRSPPPHGKRSRLSGNSFATWPREMARLQPYRSAQRNIRGLSPVIEEGGHGFSRANLFLLLKSGNRRGEAALKPKRLRSTRPENSSMSG